MANYASTLSTVGGVTTYAAAGDAEPGAEASDVESVVVTAAAGLACVNGMKQGADIAAPSGADLVAAGQSAADLLEANAGFVARPGGPIDFENNFKGQANASFLASAGNFAYYAIGSGNLSTFALDAGAGVYGLLTATFGSRHFSDLTGPMFSDSSAFSVRDAALASNGCSQ